MKILYTISGFPSQYVSGARVYAYNLAKSVIRLGHEAVILFPIFNWDKPEGETSEEDFEGVKLLKFNRKKTIEDPARIGSYYNAAVLESFKNILKNEKIDIVHYHHGATALTHCVQSAASQTGTAGVMTLHWFDPMCPKGTLLYKDAELCEGPDNGKRCPSCNPFTVKTNLSSLLKPKWIKETMKIIAEPSRLKTGVRNRIIKKATQIVSRATSDAGDLTDAYMVRNAYLRYVFCDEIDLLISPSNFLREKFIGWGIKPEHIIQVSIGMDVQLFDDFEKNKSDKIRFGYIGRFSVEKGLDVLIDAFNLIEKNNVQLNIYGEYNKTLDQRAYKDKLEKAIKREGVVFHGGFDNRRVADVFKEIDVLVAPSICYESFGLTIREAALAGIPSIISDVGAMVEFVEDGKNGLLFKRGDPGDLAAKMRRFVEDRSLIEKLKPTSENVVPMEKHAEILETVYEEVIEKRKSH